MLRIGPWLRGWSSWGAGQLARLGRGVARLLLPLLLVGCGLAVVVDVTRTKVRLPEPLQPPWRATVAGLPEGIPGPWRLSLPWSGPAAVPGNDVAVALGLPSLLALAVLVLVAHAVHDLLPALRTPTTGTALAAAGLAAVHVPALLPAGGGVHWAGIAVRVLLAVVALKLLILHVYAGRAYPRLQPAPDLLLPSRRRYVERLKHLVTSGDSEVVPILGRAGEGKSMLLKQLRSSWTGRAGRPTLVVIDVWQLQDDADLQLRILDELFSQPRFLSRYRWLRIPIMFTLARPFALLRRAFETIRVRLAKHDGELEATFRMPRLDQQRLFERVTRQRRGRVTVIALDELDRATPTVTQAALTLARRWTTPGVTVLLPYNQEFVRYKAFNPLLPEVLPDLGTSMDAVLYTHARPRLPELAARREPDRGAGPASGADLTSVPGLPDLLRDVFLGFDDAGRERVLLRFEEKYLGPTGLSLAPVTLDDVVAMLSVMPELRPVVRDLGIQLTDRAGHDTDTAAELTAAVARGAFTVTGEIPPVRLVRGAVGDALGTIPRPPAAGDRTAARAWLEPTTLAVLLLHAVDTAILRYWVQSTGTAATAEGQA